MCVCVYVCVCFYEQQQTIFIVIPMLSCLRLVTLLHNFRILWFIFVRYFFTFQQLKVNKSIPKSMKVKQK